MEKKASFTGQGGQQMPPHMHQSSAPAPDPPLKELITTLSVTDRPDLMIFRKFSEGGKKGDLAKLRKKLKEKKEAEDGSIIVSIINKPIWITALNRKRRFDCM